MKRLVALLLLVASPALAEDVAIGPIGIVESGAGGTSLTDSASLRTALSDEDGTGVALFGGASPQFTLVDLSADGLRLSAADGVLTLLGLGNGADENLTLDLDNAGANTGAFASGTSLDLLTFAAISLAFGSAPDATGRLRLSNADVISWEASPAGTPSTITVSSLERMVLNGAAAVDVQVGGTGLVNALASEVAINEDSTDVNFRVESDGSSNAYFMDAGRLGGVGSHTFGQTARDEGYFEIFHSALTAVANQDFSNFVVGNNAATTIPAGTTAIVAAARFKEPNLVCTGTCTEATTVYVQSAPTEGTSNYAVHVAAGVTRLDGGLVTPALEANLTAGACTPGKWEVDNTTTRELCRCNDAGTAYDCISVTTATGPTD